MSASPEHDPKVLAGPSGESAHQLELMASVIQALAHTADIEHTLREGLRRIMDLMAVEAASIFVYEKGGTELVCRACAGPIDVTGVRVGREEGIVGLAARSDGPVLVSDAKASPDFTPIVDQETGFISRTLAAAPLSVNDRRLGAIEIINRRDDSGLFTESDAARLKVLATAVALAMENAEMTARLVRHQRMERELELATEIQKSLFPGHRPHPFPIAGRNRPAREVSGDFYDFFHLPDGRIGFNLADVSGKGMNAALMGAKAASLMRAIGREVVDPGTLLQRVNDELFETATRGMFVTAIAGWLDPESGEGMLANAGHMPALLYQEGEIGSIDSSGPPLGIMSAMMFPEERFSLEGGRLYLYTDGIPEAVLDDGTELGRDGLERLIVTREGPDLDAFERALEALGASSHDDMTVLIVG
ncbi:MAG: PP2C family protein-serine/threonine phosphatase [Gammaproteobacteria bacterium]